MRSSPTGGERSGGFTLLELLLVLAILSLILMAVQGVLVRTVTSKRRREEQARNLVLVDSVLRRLTEDLRGAYLDSASGGPAFTGGSSEMEFITTADELMASEGHAKTHVRVSYGLGVNESDSRLTRLFRGEKRPGDEQGRPSYRELHPRVVALQFRYVVKRTEANGETACEFRERWASTEEGGLPDAVEVKLSVSGTQAGGGPEPTLELDAETMTTLIAIPAGGIIPRDE